MYYVVVVKISKRNGYRNQEKKVMTSCISYLIIPCCNCRGLSLSLTVVLCRKAASNLSIPSRPSSFFNNHIAFAIPIALLPWIWLPEGSPFHHQRRPWWNRGWTRNYWKRWKSLSFMPYASYSFAAESAYILAKVDEFFDIVLNHTH